MANLSEPLIRDTYQKLKKRAHQFFDKGNVRKGLLYTHLAAYTNYEFWLSYYDDEIEKLAQKAAKTIISKVYKADDIIKGRVVLMDSLARYRGGLTVQYVNAIMSAGWELLYITEQEMQVPDHCELYNFLSKQKKIKILEIPTSLKGINQLQFVYDNIIDFCPEKVFLHITTSDVLFTAVSYALPNVIQKYFIDLADHGFRIGVQSCDYAFEFRDLGCSILTQYLNFPKRRIFMLPFYPVLDNLEYKGLPSQCEGKIKILSGGIYWKIVDKDDTFFRLCQKLLQQNSNAIILFPGSGDPSYVKNKIKEYGLEDKFLLLGWRNDISELFRNADIFLNTYPHGGGTMSQYAAHNKIPILSYRNPGPATTFVENFVCQLRQTKISSIGEAVFLEEGRKLINNIDYRKEKAERVYSCILNQEMFNQYFKIMSEKGNNILPFDDDKNAEIPQERLNKKVNYHNKTGEYQLRLVAYAGFNSITLKRPYIIPFVKGIIPKVWRIVTGGFHYNRI